jgi:class 3 adenylate cyclase
MHCLNCDVVLEARQRNCRACGFASGSECERCGYTSLANATYCGGCGQRLSVGQDAEHRYLTVMFSDLVSSTALSERLAAEDLQKLLRSYQREVSRIIRQAQGYIAQYLGDGILAYFGVPHAQEGAARQAVLAGLQIPEACRSLASQGALLDVSLKVRVGIHTGPALLAEMGDAVHSSQLAVGATTNIAARLLAMAGEGEVVVSGATRELVEGQFVFESLGEQLLKGVSRPLSVHRAISVTPQVPGLWRPTRGQLSPLVGRASQLGSLETAWRRVGDGVGPAMVLLRGEVGVGKSRLLTELRRHAVTGRVLEAYCSPTETLNAFYPLRAILQKVLLGIAGMAQPEGEPTLRTGLELLQTRLGETHVQVLAELLRIPGFAPFAATDPHKRRQAIFQVLCDVLAEFVGVVPTLLILEDLHWADASTLEWLRVWCAGATGKLLMLVTSRPDGAPDLGERVEQLDLEPLDTLDARTLLASVFADAELTEAVARVLLERSAGVPLYIEEVGKAVKTAKGRGQGLVTTEDELSQIPVTLQESLLARLDQLGHARALAQLMATIGRSAPVSWLLAVSAASETQVRTQLDRLLEAEIVELESGSEERYAFRHALIQQVATDSLTRLAREEHHRRVAEALSTQFQEFAGREPGVVGHHFAEARQYEQAVTWLGRAAQRAMSASAFQEAGSVLTRALALLARCPETVQRNSTEIELRQVHGLALTLTHGYSASDVERTYSRARELCERSGSVPLHVLYGVSVYHLVRSDARALNRLLPLLEKFLPDASHEHTSASRAEQRDAELVSRAVIGIRLFFRGEYAVARSQFEAAHACVDEERVSEQHERLLLRYGFDGVLVSALWLVWVDLLQGRLSRAKIGQKHVLNLASRSGHAYLEAQACAYMAALARDAGDVELARSLAGRTLALCTEHGFVFWLAFGLCVQGWVSVESREDAAGIAQIQQGLGILESIGSLVNFGYFLSFLVEAYLRVGNVEAGLLVVDRAMDIS